MQISQLNMYPLKSAMGLTVESAQVSPIGMAGDRRLVVVDAGGMFITARRYAALLQVSCRPDDKGWALVHPHSQDSCRIELGALTKPLDGTLWKDQINALDAGDSAAQWMSAVLGVDCRVAVWREQARFSNKYQFETSFADASPVLIATEASMRQACDWGGVNPDMRRFRPNIVISGVSEPFMEDHWKRLRIGTTEFEILDTCTRCILTTRDPDTGEAHPGKQPMKVLMERHSNASGQPLFGVNATLMRTIAEATISVGDTVELIE